MAIEKSATGHARGRECSAIAAGTVSAGCWMRSRTAAVLEKEGTVLHYALVFLVVALIAGVLGVTGVAAVATNIAYVLFVVALVLFVVHLITGRRTIAP